MSSHHVVREKQEPALLVLGLDDFLPEYLGQLLEWSPTVVAIPETYEILHSEGIKVDWLVTAYEKSDLQNNVEAIVSAAQEYLPAALKELVKNGYTAVNIVTNKLQPEILERYTNEVTIAMFCRNEKLLAIKSGYEKWLPAGEIIKINRIPGGFKTTGLVKVSATEYKTVKDGIIKLEFDVQQLIISEFIT